MSVIQCPEVRVFADGFSFIVKPTHVSDVRAGDTVLTESGVLRTVHRSDLKKDKFMGHSLWGDTYRCGTRPVPVAIDIKDDRRRYDIPSS